MIQRLAMLSIVAAVLSISGCGVSKVTAVTAKGDSVSNSGGKGTGTVAGVKFQVIGLKEKNAGVTHGVRISQGAETSTESQSWDVSFGEVDLVLNQENGGPISIMIDGQPYGTVAAGDEVAVDAGRKVTVNGQIR